VDILTTAYDRFSASPFELFKKMFGLMLLTFDIFKHYSVLWYHNLESIIETFGKTRCSEIMYAETHNHSSCNAEFYKA